VLLNQGLARMVEAIPSRVQRIFVAGDEVLTGAPLGALPVPHDQDSATEDQRWLAQRWIFIVTGTAHSLIVPRQFGAPAIQHPLTLFALGHSGQGWVGRVDEPPVTTPEQRSAALVRKAARPLLPLQLHRDEIGRLTSVVGPSHTLPLLESAATLD